MWASWPLGTHLRGRGLPRHRALALIHPRAWKRCSRKFGARGLSRRTRLPRGTLEGLQVRDVDVVAPHLDAPALLQLPKSPGRGLPVRPDHRGQLVVGVAGGYPVALGGDEPFALD